MVTYKLYNKAHGRELVHPRLGLWVAESLQEAKKMRDLVCDYLTLNGWDEMKEEIVIRNCETEEEFS